MPIKVAACQIQRLYDREKDMGKTIDLIGKVAKDYESDVVCFPENYPIIPRYDNQEDCLKKIGQVAKDNHTHVLLGVMKKTTDGIRNSAILINTDGDIGGIYDKSNLYGNERVDNICRSKSNIFKIMNYNLGIGICYDFLFPEYVRALMFKGADFAVCLAHVPHDIVYVWKSVVIARAFENRLPVVNVSEFDADFAGVTGFAIPPYDFEFAADNKEAIVYRKLEPERFRALRNKNSPVDKGPALFKRQEFGPFMRDINRELLKELFEYYLKL